MDAKSTRNPDGRTVGQVGRALSFFVGVALIGAGCLAVFQTTNGPGTIGLLAGGVFLLLIGITGYRPTRLVIGGHEVVLERIDEVEGKVDELGAKVWELFLLTMAPSMYENLKKLAREKEFGEHEMTDGFKRELVHLRDHGYIEDILEDISRDDRDLSDLITVTDAGRRFVDLRREWQSQQ